MPRSNYLFALTFSFFLLGNSPEPAPYSPADIAAYRVPHDYQALDNGFKLAENIRHVQRQDLPRLISNLKKTILFYLGGTFGSANIKITSNGKGPCPAMVSHAADHHYEIKINRSAFAQAEKVQLFNKVESAKAFILVIFHELIHVWQFENIPLDKTAELTFSQRKKVEGHATFIQGLFAYDIGLEALNLRGLAYLLHGATLQENSQTSSNATQNFAQLVTAPHCQGFCEFTALFTLYKKENTLQQQLAKATNDFFICDGEKS